jgi:hypothetical protein
MIENDIDSQFHSQEVIACSLLQHKDQRKEQIVKKPYTARHNKYASASSS